MPKPVITAEALIEVPFHDIDVLEIAWHGHYVKYFEIGRTALLRKINYDYPQMRDSGFAWPVVQCYVKYVRPARYGQTLRVIATLVEHENRMKIQYEIRHADTNERLTKGYTVQVAIDMRNSEMQYLSPTCLLEKVRQCLG
jgi:acyl-CoA thioester hydrolase